MPQTKKKSQSKVKVGGSASRSSKSSSKKSRLRSRFSALVVVVAVGGLGSYFLFASHAATVPDRLIPGGLLAANQEIISPDGGCRAIMQTDGNFVVHNRENLAIWNAGTVASGASRVVFQTDGNLVVQATSPYIKAIWNSGTAGKGGTALIIQNDCNLVLYKGTTALWLTHTAGQQGSFPASSITVTPVAPVVVPVVPTPVTLPPKTTEPTPTPTAAPTNALVAATPAITTGKQLTSPDGGMKLILQTDGNLVLKNRQNTAIWNTGTVGKNGVKFALQTDGNLVITTASPITAVWNSGTAGKAVTSATLQDDGNFVARNASGTAIWTTGTAGKQGTSTSAAQAPAPVVKAPTTTTSTPTTTTKPATTSTPTTSTPATPASSKIVAIPNSATNDGCGGNATHISSTGVHVGTKDYGAVGTSKCVCNTGPSITYGVAIPDSQDNLACKTDKPASQYTPPARSADGASGKPAPSKPNPKVTCNAQVTGGHTCSDGTIRCDAPGYTSQEVTKGKVTKVTCVARVGVYRGATEGASASDVQLGEYQCNYGSNFKRGMCHYLADGTTHFNKQKGGDHIDGPTCNTPASQAKIKPPHCS